MGLGISLSLCLNETEYETASIVIFWATILIIPFTVRKLQKITFSEELGFLDRLGNPLKDRLPKKFPLALIAALASCALIGNIADNMKWGTVCSFIFIVSNFFLVIAAYFIIINCPISLLFHRKAWIGKVPGIKQERYLPDDYVDSICHPRYSYLPQNIHHRR